MSSHISVLVRERFNNLQNQLKLCPSSNEKEANRLVQSLIETVTNLSSLSSSSSSSSLKVKRTSNECLPQSNKKSSKLETEVETDVEQSEEQKEGQGEGEGERQGEGQKRDEEGRSQEQKQEIETENEEEQKIKKFVHFRCPACFSMMSSPTTSIFGQTTCQHCQHALAVPNGILVKNKQLLDSIHCETNFSVSFLIQKTFEKEVGALKMLEISNEKFKEGKNQEAIGLLSKAIQDSPTLYVLYANRSSVYFEMGEYELALKDANEAIKRTLIRKSPKVLIRRANALSALKKHEESLADYILVHHFTSSSSSSQVEMKIKGAFISGETIEIGSLLQKVNEILQKKETEAISQLEQEDKKIRAILQSDTECEDKTQCTVCYSAFFQPVTTPCGHSFCKSCLVRSLDHRNTCPLCRSSLEDYLSLHELHINNFFDQFVKTLNPEGYEERKIVFEQEEELSRDLPIFVCSLALPGAPCPLHIFEPRYRLMMRRCMESGKRVFGMCLPTRNGFTDHGTVLYIKNFELLPDGRSLVDTVGTKRFRVLERYSKDGYNVGKVEYYDDDPIVTEEQQEVDQICTQIRNSIQYLSRRIPNLSTEEFFERIGEPPEKASDLSLWCVNLIPFDTQNKYELLRSTNTLERLRLVSTAFTRAESSSRCSIM